MKRIIRIHFDNSGDQTTGPKTSVKTLHVIMETNVLYAVRESSLMRATDDSNFEYFIKKSDEVFNETTYQTVSYPGGEYPISAMHFGVLEQNDDSMEYVGRIVGEIEEELVKRLEQNIQVIQKRIEFLT